MTDSPRPTPLALLGLGIIGARVADHLSSEGYPLSTWSRSPRERPDFLADPSEAAGQAEVILLYLKDAPAVRQAFAAVLPQLGPGKALVNHATIDLETTAFLEEACRAAGCDFLNAPFTGSRNAAADGKLVYYAGGPPEVLARLRAVLEVSSRTILPLPTASQATIIKLVTNLVTACSVQALAEALQISRAHGLPAETLVEAFSENACGSVLAGMKLPTMDADNYEPHFSLSNMLKDSRYALQLAAAAGLDTPALKLVSEQMAALDLEGRGEDDFSVLNSQFHRDSTS